MNYTFIFNKSLVLEKNEAAHPELCAADTTIVSGINENDSGYITCTSSKDGLLLIAANISAPQSDLDAIAAL